MTRFLTTVALAVLLTVLTLGWLAFREGIFDSPEALDEQAASLDAGVFDQWPFVDGGLEDAGVGDAGVGDAGVGDSGVGDAGLEDAGAAGGEDAKGPSLDLGGVARFSANKLSITDKQGRIVVRLRHARSSIRLNAMQRGKVRIPGGHIEGVDIALYRDASGKISIGNAFRAADPPVSTEDPSEAAPWLIEGGPITLKDVILTLGFTANPVQFRIDRGTIHIRRGPKESGPAIYFDEIEGALLKPRPLPKPIRIAYAKGVVRLKGRPLVDMVARTCLGMSELRIRAVVPARKQPVELTATSIGVSSLLGRTILQSVSQIKSDKIDYQWGLVKLEGGRNCLQPATRDTDASTR